MKSRPSKTYSYSVFYERAPEGGSVASFRVFPACHQPVRTADLEQPARHRDELATALHFRIWPSTSVIGRRLAPLRVMAKCGRFHGSMNIHVLTQSIAQ